MRQQPTWIASQVQDATAYDGSYAFDATVLHTFRVQGRYQIIPNTKNANQLKLTALGPRQIMQSF